MSLRNEVDLHKYLKSIGFGCIDSRLQLDRLLQDVEKNYDRKKNVETEDHRQFVELSREYGYDCGITVCGEYDRDGKFEREYYFPYFNGSQAVSCDDIVVERHADKESYAGAYDDMRIGITLIFYLTNPGDYLNARRNGLLHEINKPLTLSALADRGKVLLPLKKDMRQRENARKTVQKRNSLIAAAQKGDQEAIESLTMEDIDIYSMISKRIQNEDLYSIVDTTFMPHGIECDQYSLIGEITEVNTSRNSLTDERMYQLNVICNDIPLDVCINERDLLGIPEPGRRFKGQVWLQGQIHF